MLSTILSPCNSSPCVGIAALAAGSGISISRVVVITESPPALMIQTRSEVRSLGLGHFPEPGCWNLELFPYSFLPFNRSRPIAFAVRLFDVLSPLESGIGFERIRFGNSHPRFSRQRVLAAGDRHEGSSRQ